MYCCNFQNGQMSNNTFATNMTSQSFNPMLTLDVTHNLAVGTTVNQSVFDSLPNNVMLCDTPATGMDCIPEVVMNYSKLL